jgi:ComF family protein
LQITSSYTLDVYAVGAYEEPLKKFVLAKRYSDILACYYAAQLIYERTPFGAERIDYIVPIPLHWRRYAERGYNQSHEIAKHLSRLSAVPVYNLLRRHKATAYQSVCDKEERSENVKDAFIWQIARAECKSLQGKRLLLVDDVMTTGATLTAAAKILAQAKPAALFAATLART